MHHTRAGFMVAAMMAISLGLFGCGAPQSAANTAESAAQSTVESAASTANKSSLAESASATSAIQQSSVAEAAQSTEQTTGSSVEPTAAPAQTTTSSSDSKIALTEEDAKLVALDDAGFGADEVTSLYATFETENGAAVFEVEFRVGNTAYDYEIDASSGAILEASSEVENG